MTGIIDYFHFFRAKKTLVILGISVVLYLLGLPMTTPVRDPNFLSLELINAKNQSNTLKHSIHLPVIPDKRPSCSFFVQTSMRIAGGSASLRVFFQRKFNRLKTHYVSTNMVHRNRQRNALNAFKL